MFGLSSLPEADAWTHYWIRRNIQRTHVLVASYDLLFFEVHRVCYVWILAQRKYDGAVWALQDACLWVTGTRSFFLRHFIVNHRNFSIQYLQLIVIRTNDFLVIFRVYVMLGSKFVLKLDECVSNLFLSCLLDLQSDVFGLFVQFRYFLL